MVVANLLWLAGQELRNIWSDGDKRQDNNLFGVGVDLARKVRKRKGGFVDNYSVLDR